MHKTHLISIVGWLVVVGGSVLLNWHRLPPEVPLWYNLPWGQDQLASPWSLWGVVALILGLGLGGEIWYAKFRTDPVLTHMVLATSLVVQLVLGLGVIRILWIVI